MTPTDSTRGVTEAADALRDARVLERSARVPEAMATLAEAMRLAGLSGDAASGAEAMRRLAVLNQQRGHGLEARRLCERSYEVARDAGLGVLAGEALNTLGAVLMLGGEPARARREFVRALALGRRTPGLRARVEQNLGILANIQGDLRVATEHYERSLEVYREVGDEHGCAITYHNLGMVHADRGDVASADGSFRRSLEIAMRTRDQALHALCLVSLAEIDVTRQRFEDARLGAESALEIYGVLGNQRGKADAYRVIGMVYRETGRPALAESRLLSAIHLAVTADATLIEAESCRELAIIHQSAGRNLEALQVLNRAHRLFKRLDAYRDAVRVGSRMADLEGTYLAVVREWGQSIETSDSRTYGHCERVAQHAVAMSRALGLDDHAETTVLLGAYLHDVGMVRVPHEILSTSAALDAEQRATLERHAMWGVELLAGVEFPWELKPIVRWHHERRDGSGYPDGLRGDEIPLGAEIVGILDAYDELLTGRFGKAPLGAREAVDRIVAQGERSWSPRVLEVFRAVMSERS